VVQSEADLIRAFFGAYNARDVAAVEEMLDPEVEITTLSARKGLATRWESRATTRRYFAQLDESWSDLRIELEECRHVGGCVVAIGLMKGTGKASQVEVTEPFASVCVIRDSRLARIDTYGDVQAAMEVARAIPAPERASGAA
jgi:ketosteroid isomerase-like protein